MNKAKKILMLVLCAALLVSISIAGTVAYLVDTEEVSNTFTVGKVLIAMDETDVDDYGVKDSENRVIANTYKLIPGRTYIKDPTIHVDGSSEKCYLFVKIVKGENFTLNEMTNWVQVDGTTDVWCYYTTAQAGDNVTVFKSFTYAANATTENTTPEEAALVITAYAIQADGFGNAADAWSALNTQLNATP